MHELSITRNVVAIVCERAAGQRVTRVRLAIGKLSAVMPEAIRFCFGICAEGTPLAAATLQIDEIPGRGRCTACQGEVELKELVGRCPDCGAAGLTLIAGQEMLIREFEFAEKETEPCA